MISKKQIDLILKTLSKEFDCKFEVLKYNDEEIIVLKDNMYFSIYENNEELGEEIVDDYIRILTGKQDEMEDTINQCYRLLEKGIRYDN